MHHLNHDILLNKLTHIGIGDSNRSWIKNYLSDRTQCTLANNTCSTKLNVNCGVPQGSVLGPLLFLIYVNDMKNVLLHSKHYLYADDTVIFMSGNNTIDVVNKLHSDLDCYSEWCRGNKLTVNTKKSNFVIYGTKSKVSKTGNLVLSLNEASLLRLDYG